MIFKCLDEGKKIESYSNRSKCECTSTLCLEYEYVFVFHLCALNVNA